MRAYLEACHIFEGLHDVDIKRSEVWKLWELEVLPMLVNVVQVADT
jgi:hypothetical protein